MPLRLPGHGRERKTESPLEPTVGRHHARPPLQHRELRSAPPFARERIRTQRRQAHRLSRRHAHLCEPRGRREAAACEDAGDPAAHRDRSLHLHLRLDRRAHAARRVRAAGQDRIPDRRLMYGRTACAPTETRMSITLIAAISKNNVIGTEGRLPWHIPEDMKHFKTLTMGKVVLMGRKTWESIPEKFRPLPGRTNVIITRQPDYPVPTGVQTFQSTDDALKNDVMVIGGAEIYRQTIDRADRLEITYR